MPRYACHRAALRVDPLARPGMAFQLPFRKQGCRDVSLHSTRDLPGDPVLLLHRHSGVEGARRVRHQAANHFRQSRFRAGVPRADEYAGMDADFPALAVAVRDLHQRRHCRRDRPCLDRRPHPLFDRLCAGRRQTRTGFRDSGQCRHHSLGRRVGRHRLAPQAISRASRRR